MKRIGALIISAIFVLMAALLGWFLPIASFRVIDDVNEGKQHDLDIDRVIKFRHDFA